MTRARDLGIQIGVGTCGPRNAITDVEGVRVGHATILRGGDIRTGVTLVLPNREGEPLHRPVFAGSFTLNGNGELTGLEWVRDSGTLTTPIGLTNTFAVGAVRDALARLIMNHGDDAPPWLLPVVGETFDGVLNAITDVVVDDAVVEEALANASETVAEGCVGAGTGTICHGFKGGIGTASRVSDTGSGRYIVGVLVQSNHGRRERLMVNGLPVGSRISESVIPLPQCDGGSGSIITVIATDAPLLPHQCAALARRSALGIGRTGGTGEVDSGDLLIAFATGNRLPTTGEDDSAALLTVGTLAGSQLDPIYDAAIEATEEAILNSLVAATTMSGRSGRVAHALAHDLLVDAMR